MKISICCDKMVNLIGEIGHCVVTPTEVLFDVRAVLLQDGGPYEELATVGFNYCPFCKDKMTIKLPDE